MKRRGFTLIELLIVIAIIGMLSTLAVVALVNARAKGRDAKRMTDLKQMQTALELYNNDLNAYPVATGVTLGSGNYACLNRSGFGAVGCTDPFIGNIQADPLQRQSYTYTGSTSTYFINANLEGTVDGMTGAIHIDPTGFVEGSGT